MTETLSNNIIVLNSILQEFARQKDDTLNSSTVFEFFTNEQILKDYSIDDYEIEEGIIDGGNDGGIDSIYLFVNGQLFNDSVFEDNIDNFKVNNVQINLYMIQSKETSSFKETVVKHMLSTITDFFELGKEMDTLVYNPRLIEKRNLFRSVFLALAPFHPSLNIHFAYCTKGNVNEINENIKNAVKQIENVITNANIVQNFKFSLLGASDLISLSRKLPQYKLPLKFEQIMNLKDSYVLLVKIKNYYSFLNDNGHIRDYLFEANIRDHQGNVAVNKEIKNTLESTEELEVNFWWLNNGVTIIASEATIAAETINLDKIQIVNGLQTSYSIYESFCNMQDINKEKELLIRVILTPENDARTDKIIKATNSQTPLPAYALRATDKKQRDIEDYLKSKNLYYDRRKNHYKNTGVNTEQIISIQYMAQVINALLLNAPHVSRSAPGTLVKNDNYYNKIFNFDNIDLYAKAIIYMKKVLNIIKNYNSENYTRHEKLDFQYHIGCKIMQMLYGPDYTATHIIGLDLTQITNEIVISAMETIIDNARQVAKETNATILAVAKSKEFTESLKQL